MKYLLVAMTALTLAGCGSKGEDEAAPAAAGAARPVVGGDDSVAAVLEPRGTPLAQLRFLIDTRPVVGKPFQVRLTLSASSLPVSPLQMAVESDSLLIDSATAVLELAPDEPASGPARAYSATHVLAVTASQSGLAELAVRLTAGTDTPETLYFIPVLVAAAQAGAAQPASSDKPDPAAEADHGQP